MKYIVITDGSEEHLFPFPRHLKLTHRHMAEAVSIVRLTEEDGRRRRYRRGDIVSAGFIDGSGRCYGHSESLGLGSRPEIDTALLKQQTMKYVVLADGAEELLFPFPADPLLHHSNMTDAIMSVRVDGRCGDWSRPYRSATIVAAGVVGAAGACHGRSETLGLDARPETDSALLLSQLRSPL